MIGVSPKNASRRLTGRVDRRGLPTCGVDPDAACSCRMGEGVNRRGRRTRTPAAAFFHAPPSRPAASACLAVARSIIVRAEAGVPAATHEASRSEISPSPRGIAAVRCGDTRLLPRRQPPQPRRGERRRHGSRDARAEGRSEHVPVEGAQGADSAGGAADTFIPAGASARVCLERACHRQPECDPCCRRRLERRAPSVSRRRAI